MTTESNTTTEAASYLDSSARKFLRTVLQSKLANLESIKSTITSLVADSPELPTLRIAEGLVDAGILSKWQTRMLLRGKKRGFSMGHYTLREPIGRGAMSVVYLGIHNVMKRPAALKILPSEETKDRRMVQRFERESVIASQLNDPNTTNVYEFDRAGGNLFLAMEYVDGLNLHELVRRDGALSIPFALDLITQACCGLAHIHDLGIVHRDMKPTNLLLKNNGVIKIIDFGLAKAEGLELRGLEPNRLLGTSDFVAPEQITDSETVDARADIYALGCTLYFLLTGQPPYPGKTVSLQLAKHQSAPIADVRKLRSDVPAVVVDFLTRLMAKQPSQRPRSVSALLRELALIRGTFTGSPIKTSVLPTGDTVID